MSSNDVTKIAESLIKVAPGLFTNLPETASWVCEMLAKQDPETTRLLETHLHR